jgi:hypothetical protein
MAGPVNPVVNRNLGMPGNDSRHNQVDFNRGGGPTTRTRRKVPPANRGGFGQHGQAPTSQARASMGGGRGSAGNPASRGNVRPAGRQSFPSEVRNPNQGGGPQVRSNMDAVRHRGGFGNTGQRGVPTVATNPKPGPGNLGGRMHKRIAGRFQQASKGSRAGTQARAAGKWGGPPVRLDTQLSS